MKFLLASILFASTQAFQAFVPHAVPFFSRQNKAPALQAETSNEAAVVDAMRISKDKGATSQEARVAWDIVEELNASDNSAAFAGGISDDCLVDSPTEECTDYVEGVEAIAGLKDKTKYSKSIIAASEKRIAESVQPISLSSSSKSSDGNSAEVTASLMSALDTAKKITEKFGITSSEAKLAWETVEEMAASGTSEATKKALDIDECDVDYSAACAALEELDRVLNLNDKKVK